MNDQSLTDADADILMSKIEANREANRAEAMADLERDFFFALYGARILRKSGDLLGGEQCPFGQSGAITPNWPHDPRIE